jgi:hypothetical protein
VRRRSAGKLLIDEFHGVADRLDVFGGVVEGANVDMAGTQPWLG